MWGSNLFAEVKATVIGTQPTRPWYVSCKQCNRKVVSEEKGYFCLACDTICETTNRFLISLRLSDSTGIIWVTAFDQVVVPLLGHTADDLCSKSDDMCEAIIHDALIGKQFMFRLRSKVEIFYDTEKKRIHVISAVPCASSMDCNSLSGTLWL